MIIFTFLVTLLNIMWQHLMCLVVMTDNIIKNLITNQLNIRFNRIHIVKLLKVLNRNAV